MEPILGTVFLWVLPWAPTGFMLCQGQLLQIKQYNALYSLLGLRYGGDGVNTFALPDLRGRIPIHQDKRTGPLLGTKGGSETVTLDISMLPNHSHTFAAIPVNATEPYMPFPAMPIHAVIPATQQPGTTVTPGPAAVPAQAPDFSSSGVSYDMYGSPDGVTSMPAYIPIASAPNITIAPQPVFNTPTGTSDTSGLSGAHQNMQPFLTLNYIIATVGIYPTKP